MSSTLLEAYPCLKKSRVHSMVGSGKVVVFKATNGLSCLLAFFTLVVQAMRLHLCSSLGSLRFSYRLLLSFHPNPLHTCAGSPPLASLEKPFTKWNRWPTTTFVSTWKRPMISRPPSMMRCDGRLALEFGHKFAPLSAFWVPRAKPTNVPSNAPCSLLHMHAQEPTYDKSYGPKLY